MGCCHVLGRDAPEPGACDYCKDPASDHDERGPFLLDRLQQDVGWVAVGDPDLKVALQNGLHRGVGYIPNYREGGLASTILEMYGCCTSMVLESV